MSASRKEILSILNALNQDVGILGKMALVTVVDLEGSGYRRVGARMLVQHNGNWVGSISGGCLEGHALRLARNVMQTEKPELAVYDTRTDDASRSLGASLGCNGLLQVWIEPINRRVITGLQKLEAAFMEDHPQWSGRILSIDEDDFGLKNGDVQLGEEDLLPGQKREGLHKMTYQGREVQIAVELVRPVIRLLIFGGGYDAQPLTELGHQLGWQITVTDDCAAKSIPARFPKADRVVHLKRDMAVNALAPDKFTAVVLLSHNFEYDKVILESLLPYNLPYIGILGPQKRHDRMNIEMGNALERMLCIHAPIGLDIGGETPFEIALAIVGEIQAVFRGRNGGRLRDRTGPIHSEIEHPVS